MATNEIPVRTDRDSVAMGDDVLSHERTLTVAVGTRLDALIEAASPDIRQEGFTWVADVDGRTSAVWSVDHGAGLIVDNREVGPGPVDVFFRYFASIDPDWLLDRLVAGAPADRQVLREEYAPIAQARRERELRRREETSSARLLDRECVAGLEHLGAIISLHADTVCRFAAFGERWTVQRADTMTLVHVGDDRSSMASIRPVGLAEVWLVAMIGARSRAARGLAPLPAYRARSTIELAPIVRPAGWPESWSSRGAYGSTVVQLTGQDALDAFRLADGRTVAEVLAVLDGTVPVPGACRARPWWRRWSGAADKK